LRASNPRWLSYFSDTLGMNLISNTQLIVPNKGNFISTCRIYITGPASDISFWNATTEQFMHINGGLTSKQSRVIDMNKLGVRISDINGNNFYNTLADDARRITLLPEHLAPSGNSIQMVAPAASFGANSKLSIEYHHSWM
jgi:hypothetical protein